MTKFKYLVTIAIAGIYVGTCVPSSTTKEDSGRIAFEAQSVTVIINQNTPDAGQKPADNNSILMYNPL